MISVIENDKELAKLRRSLAGPEKKEAPHSEVWHDGYSAGENFFPKTKTGNPRNCAAWRKNHGNPDWLDGWNETAELYLAILTSIHHEQAFV